MESPAKLNSRFWLLMLFFASVLLTLYGYRLQFPSEMYYDEVYHVKRVRDLLAMQRFVTTHPPLGTMLMSAAMAVWGDHSWTWRIVPLVFGTASILMVYTIAYQVSKDLKTASAALLLLAMDGISITQSRIAMLNSTMLFFILSSVYFFITYIYEGKWPRRKAFLLTGICLGLAISTKWVALTSVVFLVISAVVLALVREEKDRTAFMIDTGVYLCLLPLLIYAGVDLLFAKLQHYGTDELLHHEMGMLRYHAQLTAPHTYGSPWWSWPILKRPIWYFFKSPGKSVYGILCIGNPVFFWAIPPMLLVWLGWIWNKKNPVAAFLFSGFLFHWCVYAIGGRVKFFHYFYTATPFLAVLFAMALEHLSKRGAFGLWAVRVYLFAVLCMFIYWYPLLTGLPIGREIFNHHMWFKSWI